VRVEPRESGETRSVNVGVAMLYALPEVQGSVGAVMLVIE
jgi:hypothetical protein